MRELAATLMRAGATRAWFLHHRDLPAAARERDALLARLVGGPDPGGRLADGVGAPGVECLVVVGPSLRDECDVDAQVAWIDPRSGAVDWRADDGGLLAAVGVFALWEGLHPCHEGVTRVRIWHGGARQRIDALVPVRAGRVIETGGFREHDVPFAGPEIRLEYLDPADGERHGPLLPTASAVGALRVPSVGEIEVSVLGGGWPGLFVRLQALGLSGTEPIPRLDRDRRLSSRLSAVLDAAHGAFGGAWAVAKTTLLGPGVPSLIAVGAPPTPRPASEGGGDIDLVARVWRDGRWLPTMPAPASVSVAIAAALPGTLVNALARTLPGVATRIGHASGVVAVGAELSRAGEGWQVDKVVLSRGARRLMAGRIYLP